MQSRPKPKHKELQRQFEEATRRFPARTPTQPHAQPQEPRRQTTATDPRGFGQYLAQQQAATLLNERLNNSEMMLREKIGDKELAEYGGKTSARWRRPTDAVRQVVFPAAPV